MKLGPMKVAEGTQAFMFETSLQLAVTKVIQVKIVISKHIKLIFSGVKKRAISWTRTTTSAGSRSRTISRSKKILYSFTCLYSILDSFEDSH